MSSDRTGLLSLTNEGSPQARALGLQTIRADEDGVLLKTPYREDLVGDPDTGVIAGGVITTLMDHACGQAVFQRMTEPRPVATLDLRIDYMRTAEPGRDVFCQARCYRVTRHIAFVRATAFDVSAEDPVAMAQAVFVISQGGASAPKADERSNG